MDIKHDLPFIVGQQVESKSFVSGFRGAWFRCKIKDIGMRNGQICHALEFFDFPDEKISWTKLYQRRKGPYGRSKSSELKVHLMVRPCFPRVYQESEIPNVCTLSEMVVIVDNIWKVGDLVDWWADDCYWSGRITHVLGKDKVKIKLPDPPVGEGSSYEALCKDLRPSLDWSPEHGWKVPIPMESETWNCCARLIQPVNQDREGKDGHDTVRTLNEVTGSFSSHGSASLFPAADGCENPLAKEMLEQPSCNDISKERIHTLCANIELDTEDSGMGKASCSDNISSPHDRGGSAATKKETTRKGRYSYSISSKKMRASGDICLNSTISDTLESAVLDLEELSNRIKWLKRVLEHGIPLSNAMRPPWKFMENRASSMPR